MNFPNILWLCTDQQRFDTIAALGNHEISTPNLDRLCHEGVAFTRAYCQSPVCTPSRASFLSGRYPSSIHVNRNGNAFFPEGVPLITKVLAERGYHCGLVGKLHLASSWRGLETRTDDGYKTFRHSQAPHQGVGQGNLYTNWLIAEGIDLDEVFEKSPQGDYTRYRMSLDPALHQTTWCANEAVTFIKTAHDHPWLLSVNFFDPHPPFDAPHAWTARYEGAPLRPCFRSSDLETQRNLGDIFFQSKPRTPDEATQSMMASYYGMVSLIDDQIGRILDALEQSGQREGTLVVFMSDHGEMLGDHGLTQKGCRFYEGLVRVPLIISWPEHFLQGVRCDKLVELTDLAPTLAEVASTQLEQSHGTSLLPWLEPGARRRPERSFVRSEYYDAINMHAPHAPELHQPAFGTMYLDGRHKLVAYHRHDLGELYDLQEDPYEFHNLWNDSDLTGLKQRLLFESFNASILITDPGPPQIGRY